MEKYWTLSPKIREKISMYHLISSIQYCPESSRQGNCQENEVKDIQNEREELKLSLSRRWHDHTQDNPKESTHTYTQNKPLEPIRDFSKDAGYKINTKTGCISMHQKRTIWRWSQKTCCQWIKENKILRKKFNKRSAALIHKTLQNIIQANLKRPK